MTAPAKPQDHKPKKPPKPVEDEDGNLHVTVREVEYTVVKESLDDYEVMENLSDGNFVPALRALLTPPQIAAVKASLRDPVTKKVRASDMGEFVTELIGALNPN